MKKKHFTVQKFYFTKRLNFGAIRQHKDYNIAVTIENQVKLKTDYNCSTARSRVTQVLVTGKNHGS